MSSGSSSSNSSLQDKVNYSMNERIVVHELEKTSDYRELIERINKNTTERHLYEHKESHLRSLDEYLAAQDDVPISPAIAAKWIKEICQSISLIHNCNYILGPIDESNVLINEKGQAGVLLPSNLFICPPTNKYSYLLSDTLSIGNLLYRFTTGLAYTSHIRNSSFLCVPELENGLKLANVLLSDSMDVKLSTAAIINHQWIEKHSRSSRKQLFLVD